MMKTYDLRLKCPFSLILAGPSGSGKTTWVEKLLKEFSLVANGGERYRKLLWFSGSNQPELFQCIKNSFDGDSKFFTAIPEHLYEWIEANGQGSTIIIDDLMHEIANMKDIGKLFTRGRSHLNCNVITLWQNIFPKGTEIRNLSLNAQYVVVFKNRRDKSQIQFFAQQVLPRKSKVFLDIFAKATAQPYGYLLCDFSQNSDEKLAFRSNVFADEGHPLVYVPL